MFHSLIYENLWKVRSQVPLSKFKMQLRQSMFLIIFFRSSVVSSCRMFLIEIWNRKLFNSLAGLSDSFLYKVMNTWNSFYCFKGFWYLPMFLLSKTVKAYCMANYSQIDLFLCLFNNLKKSNTLINGEVFTMQDKPNSRRTILC